VSGKTVGVKPFALNGEKTAGVARPLPKYVRLGVPVHASRVSDIEDRECLVADECIREG